MFNGLEVCLEEPCQVRRVLPVRVRLWESRGDQQSTEEAFVGGRTTHISNADGKVSRDWAIGGMRWRNLLFGASASAIPSRVCEARKRVVTCARDLGSWATSTR